MAAAYLISVSSRGRLSWGHRWWPTDGSIQKAAQSGNVIKLTEEASCVTEMWYRGLFQKKLKKRKKHLTNKEKSDKPP